MVALLALLLAKPDRCSVTVRGTTSALSVVPALVSSRRGDRDPGGVPVMEFALGFVSGMSIMYIVYSAELRPWAYRMARRGRS